MEKHASHSRAIYTFGRVVGWCFIVVGTGFSFWGVLLLLDRSASIGIEGQPSTDPGIKAVALASGLIVVFLGVLLARARPVSRGRTE